MDTLQEYIWEGREERRRFCYTQERMDKDTREELTGRRRRLEKASLREPTPVEMSVDEDEMINKIYGNLL